PSLVASVLGGLRRRRHGEGQNRWRERQDRRRREGLPGLAEGHPGDVVPPFGLRPAHDSARSARKADANCGGWRGTERDASLKGKPRNLLTHQRPNRLTLRQRNRPVKLVVGLATRVNSQAVIDCRREVGWCGRVRQRVGCVLVRLAVDLTAL